MNDLMPYGVHESSLPKSKRGFGPQGAQRRQPGRRRQKRADRAPIDTNPPVESGGRSSDFASSSALVPDVGSRPPQAEYVRMVDEDEAPEPSETCNDWWKFPLIVTAGIALLAAIVLGTLVGVAQSFTKKEATRAANKLELHAMSPFNLAVATNQVQDDSSPLALEASAWFAVSMPRISRVPQQPIHVEGWEGLSLEAVAGLPAGATEEDCKKAATALGAAGPSATSARTDPSASPVTAIPAGTFDAPEQMKGLVIPHDAVAETGPMTLRLPRPIPNAWSAVSGRAYRAQVACFAVSGTVHMRLSGFFDGAAWFTRRESRSFLRRPVVIPLVPDAGTSPANASNSVSLPAGGAFPYAPEGTAPLARVTRLDVARPGSWKALAEGRNATFACPALGRPLNSGRVLRELLVPAEAVTVVEGTASVSSCRTMQFGAQTASSSAALSALGVPVLGLFMANASDGLLLRNNGAYGPSLAAEEGAGETTGQTSLVPGYRTAVQRPVAVLHPVASVAIPPGKYAPQPSLQCLAPGVAVWEVRGALVPDVETVASVCGLSLAEAAWVRIRMPSLLPESNGTAPLEASGASGNDGFWSFPSVTAPAGNDVGALLDLLDANEEQRDLGSAVQGVLTGMGEMLPATNASAAPASYAPEADLLTNATCPEDTNGSAPLDPALGKDMWESCLLAGARQSMLAAAQIRTVPASVVSGFNLTSVSLSASEHSGAALSLDFEGVVAVAAETLEQLAGASVTTQGGSPSPASVHVQSVALDVDVSARSQAVASSSEGLAASKSHLLGRAVMDSPALATPLAPDSMGRLQASVKGTATVWLDDAGHGGGAAERFRPESSSQSGSSPTAGGSTDLNRTVANANAASFVNFVAGSVLGAQAASLEVRGLRSSAVTLSLATPLGTHINVSAPLPVTKTAAAPELSVELSGASQVLRQCAGASKGCDLQGSSSLSFSYGAGAGSAWNVSLGTNASLVICSRGPSAAAAKLPLVPLALVSSEESIGFPAGKGHSWPQMLVRVPQTLGSPQFDQVRSEALAAWAMGSADAASGLDIVLVGQNASSPACSTTSGDRTRKDACTLLEQGHAARVGDKTVQGAVHVCLDASSAFAAESGGATAGVSAEALRAYRKAAGPWTKSTEQQAITPIGPPMIRASRWTAELMRRVVRQGQLDAAPTAASMSATEAVVSVDLSRATKVAAVSGIGCAPAFQAPLTVAAVQGGLFLPLPLASPKVALTQGANVTLMGVGGSQGSAWWTPSSAQSSLHTDGSESAEGATNTRGTLTVWQQASAQESSAPSLYIAAGGAPGCDVASKTWLGQLLLGTAGATAGSAFSGSLPVSTPTLTGFSASIPATVSAKTTMPGLGLGTDSGALVVESFALGAVTPSSFASTATATKPDLMVNARVHFKAGDAPPPALAAALAGNAGAGSVILPGLSFELAQLVASADSRRGATSTSCPVGSGFLNATALAPTVTACLYKQSSPKAQETCSFDVSGPLYLRPQSTGPAAQPCVLQGSQSFLGHVLSGGASQWTTRGISVGAAAAELTKPVLALQADQTATFPSTGRSKATSVIGSFALDGDPFMGTVNQPTSKELPVKVSFRVGNPTAIGICVQSVAGVLSGRTGPVVPPSSRLSDGSTNTAPVREMAPLASTPGAVLNRWLNPGEVLEVSAELTSLRSAGAFHSVADLLLNSEGGGTPGTAGFNGVVNVSIGTTACGMPGAYVMPLHISGTNFSVAVSSSSGKFGPESVVIGGADEAKVAAFDFASFETDPSSGAVVSPAILGEGTAWVSNFLLPTGKDRIGFDITFPAGAGSALTGDVKHSEIPGGGNASVATSVATLKAAPLALALGPAGKEGYPTTVGVSMAAPAPLHSVTSVQKAQAASEDPFMPMARGVLTTGYSMGLSGETVLAFSEAAAAGEQSAVSPIRLLCVRTSSWLGELDGARFGETNPETSAQLSFSGLALIDLDSNGGAVLGAAAQGVSPSITSVRMPADLVAEVSEVHAALTQLHTLGLVARPDYTLGLPTSEGSAGKACASASINGASTSLAPSQPGGTWFLSRTAPPAGQSAAAFPMSVSLDTTNATCQAVLKAQLQGNVQTAALSGMRAGHLPTGGSASAVSSPVFALAQTLAQTGLPSLQLPPAPGGGVSTNTKSDAQPYVEAPKPDSKLGVTQTLTNPTSLNATVSKIHFTVETCGANCSKLFPASNQSSAGYAAFVQCCLEGDSSTMGAVDLQPNIPLPPRDGSKAGLPGIPKTVDTSIVMGTEEQGNSSVSNVLALLSAGALSGLNGSPVLLHGSAIISVLPQGRGLDDGLGMGAGSGVLNLTLDIQQTSMGSLKNFKVQNGVVQPVSASAAKAFGNFALENARQLTAKSQYTTMFDLYLGEGWSAASGSRPQLTGVSLLFFDYASSKQKLNGWLLPPASQVTFTDSLGGAKYPPASTVVSEQVLYKSPMDFAHAVEGMVQPSSGMTRRVDHSIYSQDLATAAKYFWQGQASDAAPMPAASSSIVDGTVASSRQQTSSDPWSVRAVGAPHQPRAHLSVVPSVAYPNITGEAGTMGGTCGMTGTEDWNHYRCPDYPGASGFDSKLDGSLILSRLVFDLFEGTAKDLSSVQPSRYLMGMISTLPSAYSAATQASWFSFFDQYGDSIVSGAKSGGSIELVLDANVGMDGNANFGKMSLAGEGAAIFESTCGISSANGQPTSKPAAASEYLNPSYGWLYYTQWSCTGGNSAALCLKPSDKTAMQQAVESFASEPMPTAVDFVSICSVFAQAYAATPVIQACETARAAYLKSKTTDAWASVANCEGVTCGAGGACSKETGLCTCSSGNEIGRRCSTCFSVWGGSKCETAMCPPGPSSPCSKAGTCHYPGTCCCNSCLEGTICATDCCTPHHNHNHHHHVIVFNHNDDNDYITHECSAPPSMCSSEVGPFGQVRGIGLPAAYADPDGGWGGSGGLRGSGQGSSTADEDIDVGAFSSLSMED